MSHVNAHDLLTYLTVSVIIASILVAAITYPERPLRSLGKLAETGAVIHPTCVYHDLTTGKLGNPTSKDRLAEQLWRNLLPFTRKSSQYDSELAETLLVHG